MKKHILAAVLAAATAVSLTAQNNQFIGVVQAEWCPNGRSMRLVRDFAYFDPDGHPWRAHTNDIIDGASIPEPLWSVIGGPYEGKYRDASVVHDTACVRRDQPWKKTHRMFYHACLREGLAPLKAKIMFAAVYHFGPRWPDNSRPEKPLDCDEFRDHNKGAELIEPDTYFTRIDDYLRLREYIRQTNPRIDEIETLTRRELIKLVPTVRKPAVPLNVEMPDRRDH